jgi:hypothetical protein
VETQDLRKWKGHGRPSRRAVVPATRASGAAALDSARRRSTVRTKVPTWLRAGAVAVPPPWPRQSSSDRFRTRCQASRRATGALTRNT